VVLDQVVVLLEYVVAEVELVLGVSLVVGNHEASELKRVLGLVGGEHEAGRHEEQSDADLGQHFAE
jgi:hypothetical protein